MNMNNSLQDLRYSFRTLRHNLSFTILSLIVLALGIGASTAIFSFVNSIILSPLPCPEPERLVVISERNPEKGRLNPVVSPRNLEDWERMSRTIEGFGAWRDWGFRLSTKEGLEGVYAGIASPNLFKVLGLEPALGRYFLPEEDQPGRNQVVLLSHSYWQQRFGGDPGIVGRSLLLSNKNFTVLGVLPAKMGALGLGEIKIWAPLSIDPDQFKERYLRNRRVYARLKEGVTLNEAQAEMATIARGLAEQYPNDNAGWGVSIVSLHENEVGSVRTALFVFLGAVGLLFLIACANVANLLLARATTRRKEFAIRAALGAERISIIRLLLTESLLISLFGGVLGLLLATWILDLFVAISPGNIPRLMEVKIDGYVLGFTFFVTVLSAIFFGLLPALRLSRLDLVTELKDGNKSSSGVRDFRPRNLLVIAQVALALVLLIGAGLLTQTFLRLMTQSPGFNPDNLLTVQLFPPMAKYKESRQVAAFYQQITEEFKSIPGVESVGAASAGPQFGGYEPVEFLVQGQSLSSRGDYPVARFYDAGPNYFHTLGIPLLGGRDFSERDNAESPHVAIINETMARLLFPDRVAVGQRINLVRFKDTVEIVGIVGDVKRFGMNSAVEPEIYWPYVQNPRWAIYFVFRTASDPQSIAGEVRSRVFKMDSDVLVSNIYTMDKLISSTLKRPRFNMFLLGIFAFTALLLASVGIYGVISYSVTQRTREIGIRMALGAQQRDVLKLVIKQGMLLVLIGVVIGLIASFAISRVMSSLLYGISATDPLTFALVALILSIVAFLACYFPARRATSVDPMIALHCE
jgi:putative ABC transport system permease protein